MRMVELIEKKKDSQPLTSEEIQYFVTGFTKNDIPDYQASALLMAICLRGMDQRETVDLTLSMMHSGQVMDFSWLGVPVADKHSTGGISDTTTLILVPLCASLGIKMAKMSGRGLGHTGGTIDKLESIPGFKVELGMDKVKSLLHEQGAVIVGQSAELAPADKKLYALRDVTGTVDSIALIASSIMSKKLALGTDIIVLDVKAGSGAFMKTMDDAFLLAKTMVDIGTRLDRKVSAIVSNMDQPLGNMVGNALDVREAIETLQGKHMGSALLRVTAALGVQLLKLAGVEQDEKKAQTILFDAIRSGAALDAFAKLIKAQGGDARVCSDVSLLGEARRIIDVKADRTGTVSSMDATDIGYAAQLLGAGRNRLNDVIDPLVGIEMCVRTGDDIKAGQPIGRLHVNDGTNAAQAAKRILEAVHIGRRTKTMKLIYGTVTADGQMRY